MLADSPHYKTRARILCTYVMCICRDSRIGFKQVDFERKRKGFLKEWDGHKVKRKEEEEERKIKNRRERLKSRSISS